MISSSKSHRGRNKVENEYMDVESNFNNAMSKQGLLISLVKDWFIFPEAAGYHLTFPNFDSLKQLSHYISSRSSCWTGKWKNTARWLLGAVNLIQRYKKSELLNFLTLNSLSMLKLMIIDGTKYFPSQQFCGWKQFKRLITSLFFNSALCCYVIFGLFLT